MTYNSSESQPTVRMPSTKETPEVGTIYLYDDDHHVPRKSKWNRIPLVNFFR